MVGVALCETPKEKKGNQNVISFNHRNLSGGKAGPHPDGPILSLLRPVQPEVGTLGGASVGLDPAHITRDRFSALFSNLGTNLIGL